MLGEVQQDARRVIDVLPKRLAKYADSLSLYLPVAVIFRSIGRPRKNCSASPLKLNSSLSRNSRFFPALIFSVPKSTPAE